MNTPVKQLKVTLLRSPYGHSYRHRATVRGLGLRHIRDSRVLEDTPAIRGMIDKVSFLVEAHSVQTSESLSSGSRGGIR